MLKPSQEQVLQGWPPGTEIVADSCNDGWYFAGLDKCEDRTALSPVHLVLMRWVGDQWIVAEESDTVVFSFGRDTTRGINGGRITLAIGERVLTESVSENGWWAVIAVVKDSDPESKVMYLPGPFLGQGKVESEEARYPLLRP